MKLYDSTSLTVPQIINSKEFSLARIKKEQGETFTIAFLIKLINNAVSSFNVTNSMNGTQVTQTARAIISLYGNYKTSDFKLCFDRAGNGFYGTTFNRIDREIIMEWIHLYSIERECEVQEIRIKESNDFKAQSKEINPVLLPVLKKVAEKFDLQKAIEDKNKVEKRERTSNQKIADLFFNEFDEIHKEQNRGGQKGIKTILYNKKELSQSEYVNVRFEEEFPTE